jgi:hypothetical protein
MPNPNFPYPSVTQVLGPYCGFDRVRPDILEAACERGTDAHTPCLALAAGMQFVMAKPEVQGYFDSFLKWFAMVAEVVAVEPALVDHDLQYTGKPDLIVRMSNDKELSIVDLKTGKTKGKLWNLQLSAYKNLAQKSGWGITNNSRLFSLRLKENGGMPLADEYIHSDRDFSVFLSALNVHRYIGR